MKKFTILLFITFMTIAVGCNNEPTAGDKIRDVGDGIGDAIENVSDEVGDAADKIKDE